jgi:hypothetical protein
MSAAPHDRRRYTFFSSFFSPALNNLIFICCEGKKERDDGFVGLILRRGVRVRVNMDRVRKLCQV